MNHHQIICLIAFALVNIFSYSNGQPPPPPPLCYDEKPSMICCIRLPQYDEVYSPRLSNYTKCCGNSGITYESNTTRQCCGDTIFLARSYTTSLTTACCGNKTYLSSRAKRCCQGKICLYDDVMCMDQYCRSQQVSIN
jgi:hypothetical protein